MFKPEEELSGVVKAAQEEVVIAHLVVNGDCPLRDLEIERVADFLRVTISHQPLSAGQ
jgi:hypothetical protein